MKRRVMGNGIPIDNATPDAETAVWGVTRLTRLFCRGQGT